ncbi:MAG: sulfite exporter TauE/SafE family protein [Coriobacteriia bacterium]|nr:sulfite exporter TauE/SafE family protein [Coriobacteriia bacterium]
MTTPALTLGAFFACGLATSVHCVFMCGGLVLTYAVGTADGQGLWHRLLPHLVYQGAKTLSYAFVALGLGSLVALAGTAVDSSGIRNFVMLAAGVYMVLLGLGMTGRFPALRYLTPRPPRFLVASLSRTRKRSVDDTAAGTPSLVTPLIFGLLTGLMPCAPLIAAQAGAMAAESPVSGAALMASFGLGTAPLMLAFGFGSAFLSRQVRTRLQVVAALAVILFGLVILDRGLVAVGSPVSLTALRSAVIERTTPGAGSTTGADGVAEVRIAIVNTVCVPDVVYIPADREVRLIVDRREAAPCSDQLAIPALGVLADLAPDAVTTVTVPPAPAGEYALTCGMAMMSGRIIAGSGASGP